jgi:adenylate cyclase
VTGTPEHLVGRPGRSRTSPRFGDVVNTTARLASAARAGEVIVSVAAAEGSGAGGLERRTVEIRGRVEPIQVVVLRPAEVEIRASS